MQRRAPVHRGRVHVRAGAAERLHDLVRVLRRGPVQARRAVSQSRVHGRTVLEERPDPVGVPARDRGVEDVHEAHDRRRHGREESRRGSTRARV
eukprot:19131-Pelagococcus_subviridis.AAC.2